MITFNKNSRKYKQIYWERKRITCCLGFGRLEEGRNDTRRLLEVMDIHVYSYIDYGDGFTGV